MISSRLNHLPGEMIQPEMISWHTESSSAGDDSGQDEIIWVKSSLTEDDFMKDFSTWNMMLDGLEKIEGDKIPIRGKIIQAEICLTYR